MDEDEFEYDEEDFETITPNRRFQRTDLIVLGLDLVRGIVGAVESTLSTAQMLAAGHANYIVAREQFHQEAALEIETLITGDTDG